VSEAVGIKMSDAITVKVLKHDGAEYRRWQAKIARQDDSLLILDAEFEVDVTHELLGEIRRGTRTVEYYWFHRWYNVFRFLAEDGSTRLWYCNVNTPPVLNKDVLSYIDLDIDILVQPDLSYRILDLEEFEVNAKHYKYSETEHRQAQQATAQLISMIQTRQFPFEPELSAVKSC